MMPKQTRHLQKEAAEPAPHRRRLWPWVVLVVLLAAGVWGLHRAVFGTRLLGRPRVPGQLNVLLVTLDTTRADYLGCFGRTGERTPNIDRLAREGTLFTRCTTCSPLTLPSHASIMTAVYPYVHGARQNGTGRLARSNQTLAEALKEAGYATQATVSSYVLNRRFGTTQGFDVYHDVAPAAAEDPVNAERKGDELCDDALQLLRSLADQRFFLWVHFYDPHHPYESPHTPETLGAQAYEDEIAFMDLQLGRLLDELRKLGLQRNTLVAVLADHGEGLDQHREPFHGWFLYETTLHAPLILRCPGTIPAAQTVAAQVRTIDIAPTILELAGCPAWNHAQGVSLLPLLFGEKRDLNLAAYGETLEANLNFGFSMLRSLSAGGWKYVLGPKPELYHLDSDPGEKRNLLTERPELAAQMREQLRTLIADAPAPAAKEDVTVALDESEIRRLESLGYLAGASVGDEDRAELDRFEPQGADPKDGVALFITATRDVRRLQDEHDYQAAEQLLRRLAQAMPDAPLVHTQLGYALFAQGRPDQAVQAYRRAADLAPNNQEMQREYGKSLLRAGRYQEAADQLALVLANVPHDTTTLRLAARALAALGRAERAGQHLKLALQLEPKNIRVLHDLGILCAQQRRFPEALQYFNQALAIDPDFAECQADLQRLHQAMEMGP